MVEGEDERALALGLRGFADLAEALVLGLAAEREVQLLVGVGGQGDQFIVTNQNDGGTADGEAPLAGEAEEFPLVDVLRDGGGERRGKQEYPDEPFHLSSRRPAAVRSTFSGFQTTVVRPARSTVAARSR